MICLYCKKEFNSERNTAKYCSNRCKLAYHVSVSKLPEISVSNVSVSDKVSVPEVSVSNVITSTEIKTGVGTGVCHGCQRKIMDIKNQWVDGVGNEENAKSICICIDCIGKGITHESLGLDIGKCK